MKFITPLYQTIKSKAANIYNHPHLVGMRAGIAHFFNAEIGRLSFELNQESKQDKTPLSISLTVGGIIGTSAVMFLSAALFTSFLVTGGANLASIAVATAVLSIVNTYTLAFASQTMAFMNRFFATNFKFGHHFANSIHAGADAANAAATEQHLQTLHTEYHTDDNLTRANAADFFAKFTEYDEDVHLKTHAIANDTVNNLSEKITTSYDAAKNVAIASADKANQGFKAAKHLAQNIAEDASVRVVKLFK